MVVGIIGVLAAIAIPSYQNYQANAKTGVVESILRTAQRTWKVEESLGRTIGSLNQANLWNKIESRDKTSFTPAFTKEAGTSPTKWCMKISGNSDDYTGFGGCVDEAGSLTLAGQEIECSQASGTYSCNASNSWELTGTCPDGCGAPAQPSGTCPTSPVSSPCTAGSGQDFYNLDITKVGCSAGNCSSS